MVSWSSEGISRLIFPNKTWSQGNLVYLEVPQLCKITARSIEFAIFSNYLNIIARAKSEAPDQTAPEEQSDQGLLFLPLFV